MAEDNWESMGAWQAPDIQPVGDVYGDGRQWFKQPQPNKGPGAYVLWTDNGKVNHNFDAQGNFLGEYKGDEAFGFKDLALGGLTILGGMGLGALAGAGMGAGAVGSGAGFVGEGAASGVGAWDGALAGAGSGAGGAAGGVTVGGAMGAGLPAGTALPGMGSMAGVGAAGAGAAGLAGAGGAGGGGLLASLGLGDLSLGSLAGPLASIAGGAMASGAAGKASDAQVQAAREAAALNEPFRQGGMAGMNRLLDLLGLSSNTGAEGFGSAARDFSMADFQADPGFQFRQDEGQKALERSAAARGGLLSGRAAKDTLRFSQGLASDEFQNAFNRFQVNRTNKLNPLQSLMGAGQTSANTIGNFTSQAGDARAAGIMGRSNAINDAIGQGFSMYQGQKNADRQNSLLEMMLQRG